MSGVRLPDRIIFVSHSAKEGEAKSILDRLPDAIRDAGFHPFVSDFEIERGDPYKEVLDDRLAECHGAVLLLSPSALISDWVYDEVYFLTKRHKREKGQFLLLPFLIAGATRSTLEESRLARLGIADLHSPRTEMADVIGETIATLKRFFAQSPWYQLEANIANRLDRVRNDVLMLVADELEMDTARWQPRGWQHAIATQLLRTDRDHFSSAMGKIISVIDDPLGFIEMIFPFTWIDEEAVVPLTETATGPPPRPPLAINSEHARTGRWYVRRACRVPESWKVEQALGEELEHWDQGLAGEVRKLVIYAVGYDWDAKISDAALAERLDNYERKKGPIFFLLPSLADGATIAALRRNFPSLIFFVLAGDHPLPGGVRMLVPLLDRKAEDDSHLDYEVLTRSFRAPDDRRGRRSAGDG